MATVPHLYALTATTATTRMRAHRMATTVLIGSPAASLSERVRGSEADSDAVSADADLIADSADADLMAVDSAGAVSQDADRLAVDSAGDHAEAAFTAEAASTVAVRTVAAVSTAVADMAEADTGKF